MNGNGTSGPSWKWLVGILLTIVGAGLIAWFAVIWNQIGELSEKLSKTNEALNVVVMQLKEVNDQVSWQNARADKAFDRLAADHEMIMADHYKLTVDDDWIAAHAKADEAIRTLHQRRGER